MSIIKLRAHHGLCIAFFEGKGYDESFVKNMRDVIANLTQNPNVVIAADADIICAACPNNNNGICNYSKKVNRYDNMVLRLCNIHSNSIMPWKVYKALVKKKILETRKLGTICGDCQWAGICLKKNIE